MRCQAITTAFCVVGALTATLWLPAPAHGQTPSQNAAQSSNATAPPDGVADAARQNASPVGAATAPTPVAPPPTNSTPPTFVPAKGGFVGVALPSPPPGKAEVVFFRPKLYIGWAVWFNIRENGKVIGKLTNGVYFAATIDPGPHTFSASTENKDTLQLVAEPGGIYYVEGTLVTGVLIGEANIAPSDEGDFIKVAHNLKPANPTPDNSSDGDVRAAK